MTRHWTTRGALQPFLAPSPEASRAVRCASEQRDAATSTLQVRWFALERANCSPVHFFGANLRGVRRVFLNFACSSAYASICHTYKHTDIIMHECTLPFGRAPLHPSLWAPPTAPSVTLVVHQYASHGEGRCGYGPVCGGSISPAKLGSHVFASASRPSSNKNSCIASASRCPCSVSGPAGGALDAIATLLLVTHCFSHVTSSKMC